MKWFMYSWWKYLLQKPNGVSWLTAISCRAKNHPCGIWYYNVSGYAPDTHCKNCNDDLG
jgi:hypothetical protein